MDDEETSILSEFQLLNPRCGKVELQQAVIGAKKLTGSLVKRVYDKLNFRDNFKTVPIFHLKIMAVVRISK